MKWNIVVGSLVIGASLSGQSFGGDLLNRLLGSKGCGATSSCCDTAVVDPTCGVEIAPCGSNFGPTCGVEIASCDPCNTAPSCGVEVASCDPCNSGVSYVAVRTPVLDALKGLKGNIKYKLVGLKNKLQTSHCASACDPCGPTCGVEIAHCDPCNTAPTCGVEIASCDPCGASACDSGFGFKKRGLLTKIFSHKKHGCDAGYADPCGTACDAAPVGCNSCSTSSAAPAPVAAPAPEAVADPHAYLNTKRHVIQASSTRIR